MTLGSDVSGLSTTAATAAGHGLSIVVPVYNEAAGLAILHERLIGLARTLRQRHGLPCEVVYVDDGSKDNTLAIARTLAAETLDVQVVSLSRNFGKEAALMAGLDHAKRGAVLFMDGDGQHLASDIPRLIELWQAGRLDLDAMVTSRRPLEQVDEALDDMAAGKGLRTVLVLD